VNVPASVFTVAVYVFDALMVMGGGEDHVGLFSGVVGLCGHPAATAAASAVAWAGDAAVVVDEIEVVDVEEAEVAALWLGERTRK